MTTDFKECALVQQVDSEPGGHTEALRVEEVRKGFGAHQVLGGVDLEVAAGEFFTLLGPSGCGKTTLLRIISGLERADSGRVLIGDRDVSQDPPERRPFNMVFQSYALFPHMTVAENVAYGLRVKAMKSSSIQRKVAEALELVDLPQLADRPVPQLSGGQRQRIALARALVNDPTVLLLDEPLGALDLQLRKRLQEELRAIQQRIGTTFIYVTHDQEEALSLSDRIAVMKGGHLVQVGDPHDIYARPRTRFAAEFIGETNLVKGEVLAVSADQAVVRVNSDRRLTVGAPSTASAEVGKSATVAIRPEHLRFCVAEECDFTGEVIQRTYVGTQYRYLVRSPEGTELRVSVSADESVASGTVHLALVEGKGVVVSDDEPSAN